MKLTTNLLLLACCFWTSSAQTQFATQVLRQGTQDAINAVSSGAIWQDVPGQHVNRLMNMRNLYSNEYGGRNQLSELFTDKVAEYGNAVMTTWNTRMDMLRPQDFLISDSNEKSTLDAIVFRVPVYFGRFWNTKNNWDNLPTYLGYAGQKVKDIRATNRVRYAHFVAVDVYTPDGRAIHRQFNPAQTTWVVNTWGVNFESTETEDFERFAPNEAPGLMHKIGLGGKPKKKNPRDIQIQDMPEFQREYRNIFDRVFQGVRKVIGSDETDAAVVMPILGVGQFLTAIAGAEGAVDPDVKRNAFRTMYLQKLTEAITKLGFSSLRVVVADYFYQTAYIFDGKQMIQMPQDQQQRVGIDVKDLFVWAQHYTVGRPVKHLFVVNAGDNLSLLGNGMSLDETVEGMMMAGLVNGKLWPNSGYLGNFPLRNHAIQIITPGAPQGHVQPDVAVAAVGPQCVGDACAAVPQQVAHQYPIVVYRWFQRHSKWYQAECEALDGKEYDLGWGKLCDKFWLDCLGMRCTGAPSCQRGNWQDVVQPGVGGKVLGQAIVIDGGICHLGLKFNVFSRRMALVPLTKQPVFTRTENHCADSIAHAWTGKQIRHALEKVVGVTATQVAKCMGTITNPHSEYACENFM